MIYKHESVLLHECIQGLNLKEGSRALDMTYGRGGHTSEVLNHIGRKGKLVVIDCDQEAIDDARQKYSNDDRVEIIHDQFLNAALALKKRELCFDAVLLDLGVSSPQLDKPSRGFSFRNNGPLDMRMDQSKGETAADFVNNATEKEIADCIYHLGDETYARVIASEIVKQRPLSTTDELANIVRQVKPKRHSKVDPATKTFQAIRVKINHELDQIEKVLPLLLSSMSLHGRMAIISFQGHEQFLVKSFVKRFKAGKLNKYPVSTPPSPTVQSPKLTCIERVKPSKVSPLSNRRARSALLTILERVS